MVHCALPVSAAPVIDSVEHVTGLLAKEPANFAPVMWIKRSLVVQAVSVVFSCDRLVPPPDRVSFGENLTLAENEQCTDPSPHRALFGVAEACEEGSMRNARVTAKAAATNERLRAETIAISKVRDLVTYLSSCATRRDFPWVPPPS